MGGGGLFHFVWVRCLNDKKGKPLFRFILDTHRRLKRDAQKFSRSHPTHLVAYLKGPLPVDYHKCDIGVGIVVGNLLAWLKADLINLKIFLVH